MNPNGFILVTGGAGFIGSHLCARLLTIDPNQLIVCVDDLSCGYLQNIQPLLDQYPNRFVFLRQDLVTFDSQLFYQTLRATYPCFKQVNQPLPIISQIYHLACPASPKNYQRDPIQTMKTNVLATLHMLELAQAHRARFLFTSTSEVYGDPLEHPQQESYWGHVNPIGLRSCYDEGKRAAETLIFDFHRQYNLDIRLARLFNTYGPQMAPDDGRVVSNFICQALSNQDLTVYGSGRQTRSCCYVEDLVTGLVTFMNQIQFQGPVNLGNPDEITIRQLADKVLSLIPTSQSKLVFCPLPSDDPKVRQPDISLAKQFWQPTTDLETGLKKTIRYFQKQI